MSCYSVRTLERMFDSYLDNYPQWEFSKENVVNLLIDGTYFPNKICLVVYRNQSIKKTLFYRQSDGEYYDEILEDLRAILQRCTVHIQLMSKVWLTQNPQSEAGRELLRISQKISMHRGLSKSHFAKFLVWYLYFNNNHRK